MIDCEECEMCPWWLGGLFLIYPFQKKSKKTTETLTFKRPEGMHREVYALLYSDKKYVFLFFTFIYLKFNECLIRNVFDIFDST